MKEKGFSLVEGIIALVIVGLLAAWLLSYAPNNSFSYGIGGAVQTRCINGFQFVIGQSGTPTQVLNSEGKGIRCQ